MAVSQPDDLPGASGDNSPLGNAEEDHAFELYLQHQEQAWTDKQSGSDEFDKSILTYSSAVLGISLAFIKDIVPLPQAVGIAVLYASWIAFGIAIVVTVASFQVSGIAQDLHLEHLRKYYRDKKPEYLNAPNKAANWVGYLKYVSGASFILAIAGTIGFSIWNITEARKMSHDEKRPQLLNIDAGRVPADLTPLKEGRIPVTMTPLGKGRIPGAMTPLGTSQEPQPASPQVTPLAPSTSAPIAPMPAPSKPSDK